VRRVEEEFSSFFYSRSFSALSSLSSPLVFLSLSLSLSFSLSPSLFSQPSAS
jgi:hypothetical protein